jgi:23S rRNA pseudouridine2605 synthase
MSQFPSSGRRQTRPEAARRVGLARAISKLGICSRSQASELIRSGRVSLNGSIRRDPETPVHVGKDKIEIAGNTVAPAAKRYLMLNKPRGLVTSASDEKGRPTIYECLRESHRPSSVHPNSNWLAPVGRLDQASEGLLLMTNDSEWAARITAPETHLDKTYHVQINSLADQQLLETLVRGVTSKGDLLRAKSASVVRSGDKNSWLELVLDEGKNRHIRRMFSALGIGVLRLIRVAIGPLALADLTRGRSRPLTPREKSALDEAIKQ